MRSILILLAVFGSLTPLALGQAPELHLQHTGDSTFIRAIFDEALADFEKGTEEYEQKEQQRKEEVSPTHQGSGSGVRTAPMAAAAPPLAARLPCVCWR